MKMVELKIEGMTCGHCVMSVRTALAAVPGAMVEGVGIGWARVAIDETAADGRALIEAVGGAGYDASEVTASGGDGGA